MNIKERIVIKIPKSIQKATTTKRSTWIRRSVLRAIWEVRNKVILEEGEDIFGLYKMTDCVEVNLSGYLDTRDVSEEKWYIVRAMMRQRKKKEEEE